MKNIMAMVICFLAAFISGCSKDEPKVAESQTVPHEGAWGIYAMNIGSQAVTLIYSTNDEITGLDMSDSGSRLVFAIKRQNQVALDTTSEIYILEITGNGPIRLTDNNYFDSYPSFSPGDTDIVFLSKRDGTLDLYVMKSDGSNQQLLYNSGGHDADVDWGSAGRIAFTRDNQIWLVDSDGSNPQQVTDPPGAGTWGNANLPIGDYDPRLNPDADRVAFERMVDVSYTNGGYDIFTIDTNGTNETNLTNNGSQGYARGFANWSHSGDKIVYILSAVGSEGKYDMYMMNADGSNNHNITPGYFPATFLCHNAIFSSGDSEIYFVGQWWQQR